MNIITKLNIRQKVMLTLTILVAAFLAWQIYSFIRGTVAPEQSLKAASSVPDATAPAPAPNVVSTVPVVRQISASAPVSPALAQRQREYLNLVREYQVTKMKRQILEEQAGLANAQKRISDSGKSGMVTGMDSFTGDDVYVSTGNYQLTYLDRQAGEWSATLSDGGQLREVRVGSRLTDGSKVISISPRGVVLHPAHGKGKNLVISFQGSVNVDPASAYTVKKPKPKPAEEQPAAATPASVGTGNPDNAKIAKMLGITNRPAPTIPASPSAPGAVPSANQPVPNQPITPVTKPISVRELREHQIN